MDTYKRYCSYSKTAPQHQAPRVEDVEEVEDDEVEEDVVEDDEVEDVEVEDDEVEDVLPVESYGGDFGRLFWEKHLVVTKYL